MIYYYYYGVVMHLMLFSGLCTVTISAVNRNFVDPDSNYDNWYRCGTDQCSMALDYYCI